MTRWNRQDPDAAPPLCEIVTIGSELLLGQIQDTNTTYLAQQMAQQGVAVGYRTAVGDRMEPICEVLRMAADRSDLVLTTGGLGPTLDDLTREAVARAAGVDLVFHSELMAEIAAIFRRYGYEMAENNRRQAFVPEGAEPISNPVGTAPGFIARVGGTPVICLPGVPRELKFLLNDRVIPWVRDFFGLSDRRIIYRVLKVVGLGESRVDGLIGDLIRPGDNPEIGLLASAGEIKVRIAASARDEADARARITPLETEIRKRLGRKVFGRDDDTLEGVIEALLRRQDRRLRVVETFTGGRAAQRLHALASDRLAGSMVLPDEDALRRSFDLPLGGWKEVPPSDLLGQCLQGSNADTALCILGFGIPSDGGIQVSARALAGGVRGGETFEWDMGGEVEMVQHRGAVTGLNTLRLVLAAGEAHGTR